MFNDAQTVISVAISFMLASVCVPTLRAHADRFGLIDEPGGRKQHSGRVPIVGGLAIYLSVALTGFLLGFGQVFFLPLLTALPIVIVGVLDDRTPISTSVRIPLQIACAAAMIHFGQVQIYNIGDISGLGPAMLTGIWSVIFTVMCTVGVINSINMIDGVDGLSGSLIALTLLPITYYAGEATGAEAQALLASLIAATCGFLIYNARVFRSRASVFLGDTGSTFFGFIIVWQLIEVTQGPNAALSSVSAGWILGLPLADTIVVMVSRVLKKSSPMLADRTHFHHRLLDAGFSPNKTVCTILLIQSGFISIGVLGNSFNQLEPLLFWAFVLLTISHFIFTPKILSAYSSGTKSAVELSNRGSES